MLVELTSPEDQREKIQRECEKLGYNLTKIYSDDGFSGKTIEFRPGLQELIADAKKGQFDVIMFTKLDRLGRNLRELLNIWELITEELKIDLYCIDQPEVNSGGAFQKVMLAMLGMFAEWERNLIRERTGSGRKKNGKKGKRLLVPCHMATNENLMKGANQLGKF